MKFVLVAFAGVLVGQYPGWLIWLCWFGASPYLVHKVLPHGDKVLAALFPDLLGQFARFSRGDGGWINADSLSSFRMLRGPFEVSAPSLRRQIV